VRKGGIKKGRKAGREGGVMIMGRKESGKRLWRNVIGRFGGKV